MVTIDIYGSSDVHAHWKFPSGVSGNDNSPISGGLARIQSFAHGIDRSRSLVIDNGDTFNGSALATFLENARHDAEPLLQAIEDIAYDAMVPGNHDFDFGLARLEEFNQRLGNPMLCANLFRAVEKDSPTSVFVPYRIFEKAGIRIAVIGLITAATQQLSNYENVRDVHFADVVESLKPLIAALRPEVDLLILSYHGGLERDLQSGQPTQYNTGEDESWRILSQLPGIDGLISGHQHRLASGMFHADGRETAYVQPGYAGQILGKLSFEFVDGQLVSRSAELLDLAQQPGTGESLNTGVLDAVTDDLESWLDTSCPLSSSAICDYFSDRLHIDAVLLALPHEPSWRDLRTALQSPYQVQTLRLPAAEFALGLKALQNADLSVFGQNLPLQPLAEGLGGDYRFAANVAATQYFPRSRVEYLQVINFFDELVRLAYRGQAWGSV
ncbi:MAG: metallophosphoesterase [Microbacteriaceae bacterium]